MGLEVTRLSYTPYGAIATLNSIGDNTVTYKFTGKVSDDQSGLLYYGSRYYDPMLGRFITADSMAPSDAGVDAQHWNRHAYALNNPLKYTDPNGKIPVLAVAVVVAGLVLIPNDDKAGIGPAIVVAAGGGLVTLYSVSQWAASLPGGLAAINFLQNVGRGVIGEPTPSPAVSSATSLGPVAASVGRESEHVAPVGAEVLRKADLPHKGWWWKVIS